MQATGGHRCRPFDYRHLIYKEGNFIHFKCAFTCRNVSKTPDLRPQEG